MKKQTLKNLLIEYRSLVALLILIVVVAFLNPNFIGKDNLLNILRQTSINAVIAVGMTMVILTAGIDLSVGSVLALCGAFAATMVKAGMSVYLVIPAVLLIGLLIGSVSGLIIAKGKVQAFIVTLVTMTLLRGETLVFTEGRPIGTGFAANSMQFLQLGAGYFLGVPIPVWIMGIVFVVGWYVLTQTPIGRYIYAVGGNESATALSGIKTERVHIFVYAVSGMLSALAGLIITARLTSAQPTAGAAYELDAIAAVVVGGTSLMGGKGRLFGTLVGALIIGFLNNALNLLGISAHYQLIAKALVILIAVLLDSFLARRGA